MTVVFIAWGRYGGFPDAVRMAVARSGCPVYVICDTSPKMSGCTEIPINEFPSGCFEAEITQRNGGSWFHSRSLARWCVLLEAATKLGMSWPIWCLDWDVLVFSDLNQATKPFLGFDYCVSQYRTSSSAPYLINRPEPLVEFCQQLRLIIATGTQETLHHLQDMAAWGMFAGTETGKGFKAGNLNQIINDSTFDHNVHCDGTDFVADGQVKKIEWRNGHPYFFAASAPTQPVLAHTVHCWGTFKTRTGELVKRALG